MRFGPARFCNFLSPHRIVPLSDKLPERLPARPLRLHSCRPALVARCHTPVGSNECKAHQALGDLGLGPKPSIPRRLGRHFLVSVTEQGHPRVRSPTPRGTATHDHSEGSSSLLGQQIAGHSMRTSSTSASVPESQNLKRTIHHLDEKFPEEKG